jgi:hypothetical protein
MPHAEDKAKRPSTSSLRGLMRWSTTRCVAQLRTESPPTGKHEAQRAASSDVELELELIVLNGLALVALAVAP